MRGYFVSLSLLVSMIARADSACWPEQKLLGTPTQSLIQSVNYFLTDRSRLVETTNPEPSLVTDWQNGICQVPHFQPENQQPLGTVPCSALLCVNGECGTTDEYATLAVLKHSGDLVQVLRKSAKPVWLKWQTKPDWGIVPLWDNQAFGIPFAGHEEQIPLYQQLGGQLVAVKPQQAYQVINSVQYQGFTYLKLQSFLRLSAEDEPEIKLGAAVDVVYLKHRDTEGKLVAALSSVWCD